MPQNSDNLVDINDYLLILKIYYKSLGLEPPFEVSKSHSLYNRIIRWIILLITVVNINAAIYFEIAYLLNAFQSFSRFLEATAAAPCIGFCVLMEYKLANLWVHRNTIENFMNVMKDMFPQTLFEQNNYLTVKNITITKYLQKGYSLAVIMLLMLFNVWAVSQTIIEYNFLGMPLIYRNAYYFKYPFEVKTHLVYGLSYLQQIHAGYVAAAGTAATDVLLISMTMLCVMHFDFIAKQLREFQPKGDDSDIKHLIQIINHHQVLLNMSAIINDIFSIAVLFNFLASSVIICFVGFQMTIGINYMELFVFMQFLVFEIIQVFVISYLGNKLMESSSLIADAAYNQSWVDGNLRYRKAIMILIMRAQKPAIINAQSFAVVSLQSFTKVLSTAYQFFALLRTMYSK